MLANGKDDLIGLQEGDARTCVQSMGECREMGQLQMHSKVGAKAGGGGGGTEV
jgi:hypothetical protein